MILITGANGNLGRRLMLALRELDVPVRAAVRSRAAAELIGDYSAAGAHSAAGAETVEVRIVDYLDRQTMAEAAAGCSHVVHLVGIIKESARGSYRDAHEATCEVLAEVAAAAGVKRIVYLSILGASEGSANTCLASKGRAESLLLAGKVPAWVIRVPMVLGQGDYASAALSNRARRRWNLLLRAGSLEQPIDARDVIAAVIKAIHSDHSESITLDLAGPRSLSRRALTEMAAASLGRKTRVVSLPLWVGMRFARLLERFSSNPPVTVAMLGVLDHDDDIDPNAALKVLQLSLTDLPTTLARIVHE